MKKAVIFDFNGTLFFDNDKHIKAWDEMSRYIRHKGISEEELHTRLNGVPNHQIIEYLVGRKIDEQENKKYSLMKESLYRQACQEDQASFHLVEGVETYFDWLKEQGVPFTIASASIKENIDFFVENFHLDRWMNPQKIVYDNGNYENKEKMFLDAAYLLGCPIEDTVIFEDSLAGIHHAYKAGCHHIIVICPKEKEADFIKLPGVVKTIQDFTQMESITE